MFEPVLIIAAVATAMIYALSALGLIVAYRVAGVFNLAFGYMAALGGFIYWQFSIGWGINRFVSAILIVAVLAPLFGLAIQQLLFRVRRDVLTSVIITIGLGVAINGAILLLWPPEVPLFAQSLFGNGLIHVAGTVVTVNEVGVICSVGVVGTLLTLFLQRSRTGMQLSAIVDNPELSSATGIATVWGSSVAWMLSSALAAFSGILLAPLVYLNADALSALVIYAFAVAAFAGLSSFKGAVIGSLLLAYAQVATDKYRNLFPHVSSPRDALPFLMLTAALLIHPEMRRRVRVVGGGLQRATRERARGSVRAAVVLVVGLTVVTSLISGYWAFNGATCLAWAIAALSLVLLTGASAQISLCQVTFMGVGAIAMKAMLDAGMVWGLAALVGVLAAALTGLLIALTAWRIGGLFLALSSLAFAYAMSILVFQDFAVIPNSGLTIRRPDGFWGIDFANERWYLALVAVVTIAVIVAVGGALRGTWGRALATFTAGDDVAEASGLPVRAWKVRTFVTSASIAGLAGILFAAAQGTTTPQSFSPFQSLTLLVFAVVGGITSPVGAVIAGFLAYGSTPILNMVVGNPGNWALILFGVMAMQVVVMHPDGFAGVPAQLLSQRRASRRRRRSAQQSAPGRAPEGST